MHNLQNFTANYRDFSLKITGFFVFLVDFLQKVSFLYREKPLKISLKYSGMHIIIERNNYFTQY
jgi:hypothetical protein